MKRLEAFEREHWMLFPLLGLFWALVGQLSAGAELPNRPSGLTITNKTETSVTLAWAAVNSATPVTAYEVFCDEALVGLSTSNTFVCSRLAQDHSYVFRVRCRDANRAVSKKSNAVLATPHSGVAQFAPLTVRTQFHALVLNYDAHIWVDGS